MRLVVDTSILMAAIIKDSVVRKILLSQVFEFASLGFSLNEVLRYKDYILEKTGMDLKDFIQTLALLLENMQFVDNEVVNKVLPYAEGIMREIDLDDSAILAAALAIQADAIWADDKHFKQQSIAKVLTTKDMLKIFNEVSFI